MVAKEVMVEMVAVEKEALSQKIENQETEVMAVMEEMVLMVVMAQ